MLHCVVHVGGGRVFSTTPSGGYGVFELDTTDINNVPTKVIDDQPDYTHGIAADTFDELLFVSVKDDYIKCFTFNGTFIADVAKISKTWGIITDQEAK